MISIRPNDPFVIPLMRLQHECRRAPSDSLHRIAPNHLVPRLVLIAVKTRSLLRLLPVKNILDAAFSSKGRFIATLERMSKTYDGSLYQNVKLWDVLSGDMVTAFSHRNQDTWNLQWTEDEQFYARLVTNEVHIYQVSDVTQVQSKLTLEGVSVFSISPGRNPSVAVFVPEQKGRPAIVRLYGLLSFNYPLSNKSFYKADKIRFMWNKIGTNVLVLTQTETDQTGKSYYGETNLYYLSAVGNYDCLVTLDAVGAVHDIAWAPSSQEFVVVYGNMPAKAALFDSRANKVFDFGNSAKNSVRYSPKGRLLLMAGFGNLAGNVEVWDMKVRKVISTFKEDSAVYCEFLPDGQHILMATLSPRLRVDNRFRIRSYSGDIVWQQDFKELYQISRCPCEHLAFPDEFSLVLKVSNTEQSQTKNSTNGYPAKSAYVPPHLRGKSTQVVGSNRVKTASSAKSVPVSSATTTPTSLSSALEKQMAGLRRKLRAIDQLKEKMADGAVLEKNQLEKLSNEEALRAELSQLEATYGQ